MQLLEIEANFIPLNSYVKALEYIFEGCIEANEPLPITPVIDIFKQINIYLSKIDENLNF